MEGAVTADYAIGLNNAGNVQIKLNLFESNEPTTRSLTPAPQPRSDTPAVTGAPAIQRECRPSILLFLWPREIEVVFTLNTGHHPFPEGVPRIEAVVKRHPLEPTTTPGRGFPVDLPIGKQVIVDELPLIPSDISPVST